MKGVVSPIRRLGGLPVGIVVLGIGLGILYFLGWRWYTFTRNRITGMLPAEGRVVEIVPRTSTGSRRRDRTSFYPIIEFRTAEGQLIRFEGRSGSNPPSYRIGDAVRVRYNPQLPQDAYIDSWWELWSPVVIATGVGGMFALIGIVLVLNALVGLLQLLTSILKRF